MPNKSLMVVTLDYKITGTISHKYSQMGSGYDHVYIKVPGFSGSNGSLSLDTEVSLPYDLSKSTTFDISGTTSNAGILRFLGSDAAKYTRQSNSLSQEDAFSLYYKTFNLVHVYLNVSTYEEQFTVCATLEKFEITVR